MILLDFLCKLLDYFVAYEFCEVNGVLDLSSSLLNRLAQSVGYLDGCSILLRVALDCI